MSHYKPGEYYSQFRNMRSVTNDPSNPQHQWYRDNGIECHWGRGEYKLFEQWLLKKLGHRPSTKHVLGRIDKMKNFEPGNLRWELPKVRSRNVPRQTVWVEYRRQRRSMADWSEQFNIPYATLRRRIADGYTLKEIIKEFK